MTSKGAFFTTLFTLAGLVLVVWFTREVELRFRFDTIQQWFWSGRGCNYLPQEGGGKIWVDP